MPTSISQTESIHLLVDYVENERISKQMLCRNPAKLTITFPFFLVVFLYAPKLRKTSLFISLPLRRTIHKQYLMTGKSDL